MDDALARTLPLFEAEVPTVVDLVTVPFGVPVTPDGIVIVEADELEPRRGVVAGTVTPELVITGMVVVVVGAPVCVSVVETPSRTSLSAFCYDFALNSRSKRGGAGRGKACVLVGKGEREGVLRSHTGLNTTRDSGRGHRGAGGVIGNNDPINRGQRRHSTVNRCDSVNCASVSVIIRSRVRDGFTYAGGMSPYARPANRIIVCMEERCMMDGYSSNRLDGGRKSKSVIFRRKEEDGANEK